VLRERYQGEMREYVGVPEREDLTLELSIDIIHEAEPPAIAENEPHVTRGFSANEFHVCPLGKSGWWRIIRRGLRRTAPAFRTHSEPLSRVEFET